MRKMLLVITVMVLFLLSSLAARAADTVANPIYAQWAKFKPGSYARYVQKSVAMGNETTSDIEYKLVELTAEKAIVEMSTSMTVGGNKVAVPPTRMEHLAKLETKGAVAPATASAPASKVDAKQATEDVTVGGKSFKCTVLSNNVDQGTTKVASKIWCCDEVPGSLVKSETKLEGTVSSTTTIELTDVSAAK